MKKITRQNCAAHYFVQIGRNLQTRFREYTYNNITSTMRKHLQMRMVQFKYIIYKKSTRMNLYEQYKILKHKNKYHKNTLNEYAEFEEKYLFRILKAYKKSL